MNHLTTTDVVRFIDGELSQSELTRFAAHLQQCDRCQKELRFQRALLRVAHETPLVQPRSQFTQRVMEQLVPAKRHAWTQKILNNLGNIFAMMLVLGVLGYALSSPEKWMSMSSDKPSQFAVVVNTYSSYYAGAKQFLGEQATKLMGERSTNTTPSGAMKVLEMTIVSILALAALDKFVLQRVTRMRP